MVYYHELREYLREYVKQEGVEDALLWIMAALHVIILDVKQQKREEEDESKIRT